MSQVGIEQTFQLAMRQHQAGQLGQAETLYRQVLAEQPGHAAAMQMLGVLADQLGRSSAAVDLIRQAIALQSSPEAYCNLGNALTRAGRLEEAAAAYRQAIDLRPDYPKAFSNLGNALKAAGQIAEAIAACRKAIELKEDFAEAHSNLGNALKEAGQRQEAIAAYHRAIELRANYPEAHNNLGMGLKEAGQLEEAIAEFRQAIVLMPNYPTAYCNLGNALMETGQTAEAIAAFGQAIALRPDSAEYHNNMGVALREAGRAAEAIAACRKAISLRADLAEAYNNLGNTLRDVGHLEEAISACRQAIALKGDYPEAFSNLGNALRDAGQRDEAMAAYRQAVALRPSFAQAYRNLGIVLRDTGQVEEAIKAHRKAIELQPDYAEAHGNLIFAMHYHPGCDARMIAEENKRWNQRFAEPLKGLIREHANARDPDRRLKIGYVSPDFRNHPVGRFLLPLLKHHDKSQVEVVAYSQAPGPDAMTGQLRACLEGWREIGRLPDEQAAEMIREDRIDILVDLAMHSAGNRLLVFARKPAPVQATYLAYCSSTGLTTIDYRLSDPFFDPEGEDESIYSERTIRLPETYWCYHPAIDAPPVNKAPALERGFVMFVCLNNFCKVNERVLAAWAKILQAVPKSEMLIHSHEGAHRGRVWERLERDGIERRRVRFVGRLPIESYFEIYGQTDIALDTFPFGGGTTTCDALWMGVPVISLAGKTGVGRGGLSILSNIGLPELAAHSEEKYVRLARDLAYDLGRLSELRGKLRRRMERSPLMNAPRFARNVEAAYRQMWRTWCAAS